MQFKFNFWPEGRQNPAGHLQLGGRSVPLHFFRNVRARRYVLRVRLDGSIRVTIPRGGTLSQARIFAERNAAWLERQLLDRTNRPPRLTWGLGTVILFHGAATPLELACTDNIKAVRLGTEIIQVKDCMSDLRSQIEKHLWKIASQELPLRVWALAGAHGIKVNRVTVRSQRSRWGSCSRRGTISLNWRLVQAPDHVRDYIVLHELAHMLHMNHSGRFWQKVESLCPDYRRAEAWLKAHTDLLR